MSTIIMSRGHSKEEINIMVNDLIDELRECVNGLDITTCQLIKMTGYVIAEG